MLVILVRHASTALNNPSNPKVRAWKDEPLSPQGRIEAQMTAIRLRKYKPQFIFHSDFMRDSETAQIIGKEFNISPEADFNARTWDVGLLSGKPEKEANPLILSIYKRPWETLPGGYESFNDFSGRWLKFLDERMQQSSIESMRPGVIVTHGRNCALTHSYIDGLEPIDGFMPYPSGMAVVSVNEDRSLSIDIQEPKEPVIEDV